jgi:hypothetical protein
VNGVKASPCKFRLPVVRLTGNNLLQPVPLGQELTNLFSGRIEFAGEIACWTSSDRGSQRP